MFGKNKFQSKIPEKYRSLNIDSVTDAIMDEILEKFPEIKIPSFIEVEEQKGNLSPEKAKELKKRSLINGINDYVKKEEERFKKEKSLTNKIMLKKNAKIKVYESEANGIITDTEVDFLLEALK